MHVSLNEIERLVERATRAAGAAPGADTEAGRHAAWLEARGLPALRSMAASLGRGPCAGLRDTNAIDLGGASLAFHAGTLMDLAVARGRRLEITGARDPLFLVAAAVRFAGRAIRVAWRGDGADAAAALEPHGELRIMAADRGALTPDGPVRVDVILGERAPPTNGPPALAGEPALAAAYARSIARGIEADDGAWRVLTAFAARTYVPASSLSRSRGAGAEVDDSA